MIDDETSINPHLFWSMHPNFEATNYKIYRAISSVSNPRYLTYSLIYTTSADVFEYIDTDLRLGNSDYIFYYVVAYNSTNNTYSEPSNVSTTRIGMYKQNQIADESENNKLECTLSQNTPNPFNPSTTIKYSVPGNEKRETKNVKLTVYDVLGNEVATLVNEQKPAGNYEVKFDGSNLSSGVYFYKLQSGSFVQTRKMLMII